VDLEVMAPSGLVDPRVRLAPVASELRGGRRLADWLTATPDAVLVEQFGIRMLILGTDDVLVDVDDGADLEALGPLLYGFAVRALLLHAGTFCLHATVVRCGEVVTALAGQSGAGKSTTAAALCRFHGASLLVDDVVPTRIVGGRAQVHPFDRPVHLTVETIERLELRHEPDQVGSTGGPRGKVALPATRFGSGSGDPTWIGLDRILALSFDGAADDRGPDSVGTGLIVREVSGAERLRWIVRLSNVTGLASLGARSAAYFEWATGLANALDMVAVERPDGPDTLDEVCATVLGTRAPSAPGSRDRW
jgi:hypothetical protein